jgi:hypothetical protein
MSLEARARKAGAAAAVIFSMASSRSTSRPWGLIPREIANAASGMRTEAVNTMLFRKSASEPKTRCVMLPINWLPSAPNTMNMKR